jgi:hypothetical protein
VEKELTGKEEEPSELIYFKVYKSQIPVIEQAIETAARMLGTDKSRGYRLEMICADFLAEHTSTMAARRFCSPPSHATTSSCQANSSALFSHKHIRRHHQSNSIEATVPATVSQIV